MADKGRLVLNPEQAQALTGDDPDDLLLSDEARAAKASASGAAPAPASATVEEKPAPAPAVAPPAPVEAPVAAPEVAPTEEVWDAETVAALGRLDTFLEARDQKQREALRSRDQTITRIQQEHATALKSLREELRQTQLTDLNEDERKALQKKWTDDDRKTELDEYAKTLEGYDHDLMVGTLVLKYGQYGVTEEDLADKPVSEMELFCSEKKADHFEQLSKGGIHAATLPNPVASGGTPAPAAAQPVPAAPAGASAPSDVGSGTPAPEEPEFDKGQGRDSMLKNLRNLPAESLQARKA